MENAITLLPTAKYSKTSPKHLMPETAAFRRVQDRLLKLHAALTRDLIFPASPVTSARGLVTMLITAHNVNLNR